jgi:hypothetical protein
MIVTGGHKQKLSLVIFLFLCGEFIDDMISSVVIKMVLPAPCSLLVISYPARIYALSPYQSGYEHGISDAKKVIQGSKDFYILQPGNGWTDGAVHLRLCVGLNSTAEMPRNWRAGYDYANNESSQNNEDNPPHSFECPLSKPYWQSNFCIGYDAALAYQNRLYV